MLSLKTAVPGAEFDNEKMPQAIIIGAGPAGLTAAYELLTRTEIHPVVLEKDTIVGGISRTVNYKGNRIDIGGHRFFSKSDRVMQFWLDMMPLEASAAGQQTIAYQNSQRELAVRKSDLDPSKTDDLMLLRPRKSRIYYLRKFFDYPLKISKQTILNLGLLRMWHIGWSYLKACTWPIRNEKNLEEFFINRFGRELYRTFFKSYTEKVWGVPCDQISASWGAQRIKGLSILKAVSHALTSPFRRKDIAQKGVETTLIEQFLYPKHGPGQMWEICRDKVLGLGGDVQTGWNVETIHMDGNRVRAITARNGHGETETFTGDWFFSTMPIQELVRAMDVKPPADVCEISEGLQYRDFITVGLLTKGLKIRDKTPQGDKPITDNWIYIQEPDVIVGRLQVFNNWSPYMVAQPGTTWIGLEYFCNEGDEIWTRSEDEMVKLAIEEMIKIDILEPGSVIDSTVIRMPKTYPAYFGTYDRFDRLQQWVDGIENLFLVGRNGMHRYNNQDHSMLTAMTAVDNILAGRTDRSNLWSLNTEQEYHEEKSAKDQVAPAKV
jgi:protoporphyrinogen oxidase